MDTLISAVTQIRRSVLKHGHFLRFREEVARIYDDDVSHLLDVQCYANLFLFAQSNRFSMTEKGKVVLRFSDKKWSRLLNLLWTKNFS
jgi:hypothetical protein